MSQLLFFAAQYGGWQRVTSHHLHHSVCANKISAVIFQPYHKGLERAHNGENVHTPAGGPFVNGAGGDGKKRASITFTVINAAVTSGGEAAPLVR